MLSIFMPLLWEAGWQLFLVWALWLAWQSIVITRETGLEIDGDGDGAGKKNKCALLQKREGGATTVVHSYHIFSIKVGF